MTTKILADFQIGISVPLSCDEILIKVMLHLKLIIWRENQVSIYNVLRNFYYVKLLNC